MVKDLYHDIVKEALITDGWSITEDPLTIEAGVRKVHIDLGAEKLIVAQKGIEKIAVEVKSFLGQSPVNDFSNALGKYDYYSFALRTTLPRRTLFLAMPLPAYDELFSDPFMDEMTKYYSVSIIVFDPIDKKIVSWIKH